MSVFPVPVVQVKKGSMSRSRHLYRSIRPICHLEFQHFVVAKKHCMQILCSIKNVSVNPRTFSHEIVVITNEIKLFPACLSQKKDMDILMEKFATIKSVVTLIRCTRQVFGNFSSFSSRQKYNRSTCKLTPYIKG